MRASDKNFYVVKFQNNPQHIRVLANEFLASRLGRSLGLPMPEVQVIDVSEWLITNTAELRIQSAAVSMPCTSGLQLGCRYAADDWQEHVFDYLPDGLIAKLENRDDFPRVLAFDKWTANSDGRQAVFTKSPRGHYRAVFIDQGHCFNAAEWTFPDLSLHGVYFSDGVYLSVTGWNSFEPVLSKIEAIDPNGLWQIAKEIPAEWYDQDEDALSRLIETLCKRRLLVRDLITAFRNSSRNPFPKWAAK